MQDQRSLFIIAAIILLLAVASVLYTMSDLNYRASLITGDQIQSSEQ